MFIAFPLRKNVAGIRAHTYSKITVDWALEKVRPMPSAVSPIFFNTKKRFKLLSWSQTAITEFWKFRGKDNKSRKMKTTMTQPPEWLNRLYRIGEYQKTAGTPMHSKAHHQKYCSRLHKIFGLVNNNWLLNFSSLKPWTNNFTKINSSIVLYVIR